MSLLSTTHCIACEDNAILRVAGIKGASPHSCICSFTEEAQLIIIEAHNADGSHINASWWNESDYEAHHENPENLIKDSSYTSFSTDHDVSYEEAEYFDECLFAGTLENNNVLIGYK